MKSVGSLPLFNFFKLDIYNFRDESEICVGLLSNNLFKNVILYNNVTDNIFFIDLI